MATILENSRWNNLSALTSRASPFGNETGQLPNGIFEPSSEVFKSLQETSKVLVIGAGGLGCEILKDLSLSGFRDIHVIDLDTIDISNLNRQFLFRKGDVGRSKSEVAAEFIMKRVSGCRVTPYIGKIQDRDDEFYKQFKVIVCGLDNIEARRWLNSFITSLVRFDADGEIEVDSLIPIIDGGTEGFKGQARIILPRITACYECSVESIPRQETYPLCTISSTPRRPEHCIEYAFILEWDKYFPTKKMDADNPEHMQWVFEKALERAVLFGIEGVTYFKTLGVVKRVIPAVASSNAIISAACVNEVFKLITFCAQSMNSYYMYMGSEGVYTNTIEYGRKDGCIVCGDSSVPIPKLVSSSTTLQDFIQLLQEDPQLQLKSPSIAGESISLYFSSPPTLRTSTEQNLSRPLGELIRNGEILTVTDSSIINTISVKIELFD